MSCIKTEISNIDSHRLLLALSAAPECFAPTGSRVYGGFTPNSDYDYVVNPKATWRHGQMFNALLVACAFEGGPKLAQTPISTKDNPYRDADGKPFGFIVEALPDIEVTYVNASLLYASDVITVINFIFPGDMLDYKSWLLATSDMKNLTGRDRQRCIDSKDARALAFRTLRRTHLRYLKQMSNNV